MSEPFTEPYFPYNSDVFNAFHYLVVSVEQLYGSPENMTIDDKRQFCTSALNIALKFINEYGNSDQLRDVANSTNGVIATHNLKVFFSDRLEAHFNHFVPHTDANDLKQFFNSGGRKTHTFFLIPDQIKLNVGYREDSRSSLIEVKDVPVTVDFDRGFLLISMDIMFLALHNPVEYIAELVRILSFVRDYTEGRLDVGIDTYSTSRTRAELMAVEWFLQIKRKYPQYDFSDAAKELMRKYPDGFHTRSLRRDYRYLNKAFTVRGLRN